MIYIFNKEQTQEIEQTTVDNPIHHIWINSNQIIIFTNEDVNTEE